MQSLPAGTHSAVRGRLVPQHQLPPLSFAIYSGSLWPTIALAAHIRTHPVAVPSRPAHQFGASTYPLAALLQMTTEGDAAMQPVPEGTDSARAGGLSLNTMSRLLTVLRLMYGMDAPLPLPVPQGEQEGEVCYNY